MCWVPVQRNNLVNLIIGLTAFALTSLMCILLSTRISSPLRNVAIENERIGTFDLTANPVGRSHITEVDQLLVATESMKKKSPIICKICTHRTCA